MSSGRAEFEPFKAKVCDTVPLMTGPAASVASLLDLPKDAEVFVIAARDGFNDTVWYQVTYQRRTGWVSEK